MSGPGEPGPGVPDLRSVLGFQIKTARRWALGVAGSLTGEEWLSRPGGAMDRNLEIVAGVSPESLNEPIRLALPQALLDFLRTRERWLGFSCLHLSYHLGQISLIEKALHRDPA